MPVDYSLLAKGNKGGSDLLKIYAPSRSSSRKAVVAPHGVRGFLGNFVDDVQGSVAGFFPGLVQTALHPLKAASAVKHAYTDNGTFWHELVADRDLGSAWKAFYEHPLGPVLDVAGLVTAGAGTAARGAGLLAKGADAGSVSRLKYAGMAGLDPVTLEPLRRTVSGQVGSFTVPVKRNPLLRPRQDLFEAISSSRPNAPLIGSNARVARNLKRRERVAEARERSKVIHPVMQALNGLSRDARMLVTLRASGHSVDDALKFGNVRRGQLNNEIASKTTSGVKRWRDDPSANTLDLSEAGDVFRRETGDDIAFDDGDVSDLLHADRRDSLRRNHINLAAWDKRIAELTRLQGKKFNEHELRRIDHAVNSVRGLSAKVTDDLVGLSKQTGEGALMRMSLESRIMQAAGAIEQPYFGAIRSHVNLRPDKHDGVHNRSVRFSKPGELAHMKRNTGYSFWNARDDIDPRMYVHAAAQTMEYKNRLRRFSGIIQMSRKVDIAEAERMERSGEWKAIRPGSQARRDINTVYAVMVDAEDVFSGLPDYEQTLGDIKEYLVATGGASDAVRSASGIGQGAVRRPRELAEAGFRYEPFPDAINNGTWYHGGGSDGITPDQMTSDHLSPDSLMGMGFYMTRDPRLALKYARGKNRDRSSGSSGTVYQSRVRVNNVIDAEAEAPLHVKQAMASRLSRMHEDIDVEGILQADTLADAFAAFNREASSVSREYRIPRYEFGEMSSLLAQDLKQMGYDAITHIGGTRAGRGKLLHQVLIVLDPEGNAGRGSAADIFSGFGKVDLSGDGTAAPVRGRPMAIDDAARAYAADRRVTASGLISPSRETVEWSVASASNEAGLVNMIPKRIYDELVGEFNQAHRFIRMWVDRPTRIWRALTLNLRSGWIANNYIGQMLLLAAAYGVPGLKEYVLQFSVPSRAKRLIVDDAGVPVLGKKGRHQYRAYDAFADLAPELSDFGWAHEAHLAMRDLQGNKVTRGMRRMSDFMGRLNQRLTDDHTRRAAFMAELRPHVRKYQKTHPDASFEEAAKKLWENEDFADEVTRRVLDNMIDFTDLSNFERSVIKRAIPFYAWLRGMTKRTAQLAMDEPWKLAVGANIGEVGLQRNEDMYGSLPEFLKGIIGSGGNNVLVTQGWNPFMTPADVLGMVSGGVLPGQMTGAQNPLATLNPVIKAPIEAAANTDFFYGRPIVDPRTGESSFAGRLWTQSLNSVPQWRVAKQGLMERDAKRGKLEYDPLFEPSLKNAVLSYLGIPIRTMDVNQARQRSDR